ncbi:tRNA-(ms[2]io[6]A)-hydroxylase, partial [Porticoccaceae bacterium]|nr:tRNA-(ms[2]io[6]A)-hydroxylase [Porticoccaceae bacterium]
MTTALQDIQNFLPCKTPDRWLENALDNQAIMLIDHANCEKKAASTAMNLIYRYVDNFELINKMSRLIREEMRHFEQVIAIMRRRDISY